MAIRGQRPKPLALRVVTGNAGHRPLPTDTPVMVDKGEKPAFLRGRASAIWDIHAPILDKAGVLANADVYSLAAWCQLAALVEKGAHKMPSQQLAQWRALSNEFGLTPSARARLKVDKPDKANDPAAKWFGEAKTR